MVVISGKGCYTGNCVTGVAQVCLTFLCATGVPLLCGDKLVCNRCASTGVPHVLQPTHMWQPVAHLCNTVYYFMCHIGVQLVCNTCNTCTCVLWIPFCNCVVSLCLIILYPCPGNHQFYHFPKYIFIIYLYTSFSKIQLTMILLWSWSLALSSKGSLHWSSGLSVGLWECLWQHLVHWLNRCCIKFILM